MSHHKVTMRYTVAVILGKYNVPQKHRKKSKFESYFQCLELKCLQDTQMEKVNGK